MAFEIEGLEFKVNGDISGAQKAIDDVRQLLTDANREFANLGNLTSAFQGAERSLSRIDDALFNIVDLVYSLTQNESPLNGIAQQFRDIGDAVRTGIDQSVIDQINSLTQALAGLRNLSPDGNFNFNMTLYRHGNGWRDMGGGGFGGGGRGNDTPDEPRIDDSLDAQEAAMRLTMLTNAFNTVGTAAGLANMALTPITGTVRLVAAGMEKLGSVALTAGRAMGGIVVDGLKASARYLASPFTGAIKGASHALHNLFNSVKRVVFYRAIRAVLSALTKGIKEGTENLYQYSRIVGTDFAPAMDRMATSALYLKNSLAAMVSPILEAVAPAFDYLVDKIVEGMNWLNMFFAKLAGKSTYTAAVRQATTWGDAAKDATGKAADGLKDVEKAAKRTILAFDELNVLNSPQTASTGSSGGSGSSGSSNPDYSTMFEERAIESSVGDLAEALRRKIEEGDWEGVGREIASHLNGALEKIDTVRLGEIVGQKINNALHLANGFLREADFALFGSKIAGFLNGALSTIDFSTWGENAALSITNTFDGVIGFLGTLDWGQVGTSVHDMVTGFFGELSAWIQSQDWKTYGAELYKKIKEFISNLKLDEIVASISEFLGSALKGVIDSLAGFFSGLGEDISKWWKEEIEGVTWYETLENFLVKGVGGFFQWIYTNIVDPFATALFDSDVWQLHVVNWANGLIEAIKDNPVIMALIRATPGGSLTADMIENYEGVGVDLEGQTIEVGGTEGHVARNEKGELYIDFIVSTSEKSSKFWRKLAEDMSPTGIADVTTTLNKDSSLVMRKFEAGDTMSGKMSVNAWIGSSSNTVVKDAGKGNTTAGKLSVLGTLQSKTAGIVKKFSAGETQTGTVSALGTLQKKTAGIIQKFSAGETQFGDVSVNGKLSSQQTEFFSNLWNGNSTTRVVNIVAASAATNPKAFQDIWNNNVLSLTAKVNLTQGSNNTGLNIGMWTATAQGGAFYDGAFHRIPQYASGGTVHGSMFLAGEAGPEVVGHIGGRTEVLNASQLASVMYAAVTAGMAQAQYGTGQMLGGVNASLAEMIRLAHEQIGILEDLQAGGLSAEVTTRSFSRAQGRYAQRVGYNA